MKNKQSKVWCKYYMTPKHLRKVRVNPETNETWTLNHIMLSWTYTGVVKDSVIEELLPITE